MGDQAPTKRKLDTGRYVRLFSGDWDRLVELAEREDRDVAYLVRTVIRDWLDTQPGPGR